MNNKPIKVIITRTEFEGSSSEIADVLYELEKKREMKEFENRFQHSLFLEDKPQRLPIASKEKILEVTSDDEDLNPFSSKKKIAPTRKGNAPIKKTGHIPVTKKKIEENTDRMFEEGYPTPSPHPSMKPGPDIIKKTVCISFKIPEGAIGYQNIKDTTRHYAGSLLDLFFEKTQGDVDNCYHCDEYDEDIIQCSNKAEVGAHVALYVNYKEKGETKYPHIFIIPLCKKHNHIKNEIKNYCVCDFNALIIVRNHFHRP